MNKVETLTSRLLEAKLGQSLPDFIQGLMADGADTYTVQSNLAIATGEVYDRRTVLKWMDTYK